jgi:tetratricopeptide (TPR) repeat protein
MRKIFLALVIALGMTSTATLASFINEPAQAQLPILSEADSRNANQPTESLINLLTDWQGIQGQRVKVTNVNVNCLSLNCNEIAMINPARAFAQNTNIISQQFETPNGEDTDPIDSGTYYNQGNAKARSGDSRGAIEDYTRAIKNNPNFNLAFSNRGAMKARLGDYRGAIEDLNRAINIDPNFRNPDSFYTRGVVRARLGDKRGAIEDLKVAAQIYKKQDRLDLMQKAENSIKRLMK